MSERANGRREERGSEGARERGREAETKRVIVRTFRDLLVWQRSMELARAVYRVSKLFPPDERFGLTSQVRRGAVSIPSNIAEGHGRQSRADYLRCLRIARGSLAEVGTQLDLAISLAFVEDASEALSLCDEVARMLQALIRALESKEGHA